MIVIAGWKHVISMRVRAERAHSRRECLSRGKIKEEASRDRVTRIATRKRGEGGNRGM